MKKKILCACLCACILLCACVLPSSASEKYFCYTAIVIDSDDIEGFANAEGILRSVISQIHDLGVSATFYLDADDIEENHDLAAALIYFKVNGFDVGIFTNDTLDAQELNYIIRYITKSASRLVLCEEECAEDFENAGYSAVSKFDLTFSKEEKGSLSLPEDSDTFVLFDLYEGSWDDIKSIYELALEKNTEVRGVIRKTN